MVVKRDILFNDNYFYFQGFMPRNDKINFEKIILDDHQFMEKDLAETNHEYKQPIAYFLIADKELKKAFLYQRAIRDEEYAEKRLQGKLSIGLGGHIEKSDKRDNPILHSMLRELDEEVEGFVPDSNPEILGYINDDVDDVGKVHFGLLYAFSTNSHRVYPKDKEIKKGGLIKLEGIRRLFSSDKYIIEGWSKIALKPLEELLK